MSGLDEIAYLKAKKAQQLAEEIVDGEVDLGVLRTNIDQKLNDLETEYAPQLTSVTAQLADAVKKTDYPLLRNIHVSYDDPDDNVGDDGDVWLKVMPANAYYYLGDFEDRWVNGATTGSGTTSKESDHLNVDAVFEGGIALKTLVTDVSVSLDSINTIYVEWENTGSTTGGNETIQTKFNVSTDKMGDQTVYNARISKPDGAFGKVLDTLDVSGLMGNYYLRAHARATGTGQIASQSTLKIYRIWGE